MAGQYLALFERHVQDIIQLQNGWVKGICPFHEDSSPSWSGNPDTGVWKCFGCDLKGNAKSFADRVGESLTRNPPPPKASAPKAPEEKKSKNPWRDSKVVDTYDYTDEKGNLLYQVVRFEPKDFRQRRPDGESWVNNLQDVRRVLFGLGELQSAPLSEPIFFTEGEKDALRLRSLGKFAVTVDGGIRQNPPPAIFRSLAKRRVVLLPDNDDVGQKYADKIEGICKKVCLTVQRINLPGLQSKEDVSSWFDAGRTVEELDVLVKESPILGGTKTHMPVYSSLSEFTEKAINWLWYPYIPLGRITMLEGDPGQGKSWFSLATAASVTQGVWPFGLDLDSDARYWGNGAIPENLQSPGSVLYITCEDDPEDTIKKRLRIVGADDERVYYVHGKKTFNSDDVLNITLQDTSVLKEMIEDLRVKLTIVDPIQAYMPTTANMNESQKVRPVMRNLQQLAAQTESAFLLIRHLSKSTKDRVLYRGSGSIDFSAAARSVLLCAERRELSDTTPLSFRREFGVVQVKNNIANIGQTITFELQRDLFNWLSLINISAEDLMQPAEPTKGTSLEIDQARNFLQILLADSPLDASQIKREAKAAGIDFKLACVVRDTDRYKLTKNPLSGEWTWALPQQRAAPPLPETDSEEIL